MAGYVIADIDIIDSAIFEQYRSQDGPSIDKYGGKFIVRGGAAEKVEGLISWGGLVEAALTALGCGHTEQPDALLSSVLSSVTVP